MYDSDGIGLRLTHWGWNKMANILQTTFSKSFFCLVNCCILCIFLLDFFPKDPTHASFNMAFQYGKGFFAHQGSEAWVFLEELIIGGARKTYALRILLGVSANTSISLRNLWWNTLTVHLQAYWLADCYFGGWYEYRWVFIISVWLGQYHGYWCPGSLRRQDINSHDIDFIEYVGPSLT